MFSSSAQPVSSSAPGSFRRGGPYLFRTLWPAVEAELLAGQGPRRGLPRGQDDAPRSGEQAAADEPAHPFSSAA
jgi:hypothetical protein